MKRISTIYIYFLACCTVFSTDLKREKWHVPIREYKSSDSSGVPFVEFALIQKIEVGTTLEVVKKITGIAPVNYYIHPNYAVLATKINFIPYEAAFLLTNDKKVQAISFRELTSTVSFRELTSAPYKPPFSLDPASTGW